MRSAQERTKSLQEAFEQSIILKSVHLDPENQRVAVELPLAKEPVEFLTKRHGRNTNYYQALRVCKLQYRKPVEVKAKLRSSMQDLIECGFTVKLSDMEGSKREVVAKAEFHYFPWRAVYKEGSVSTPIRIVVDPCASGLNQTLAKGENMLTKWLCMWTFNRVKEITTMLRWVIGSNDVRPLYHIGGGMNTADMVTRPWNPAPST
jgi:hypothetical protein